MKLQQKIKLSFLLVFSLLGIGAFAQSTKTAHQKVLFENINSFQQYVNSNVYLKCGNEENLILNLIQVHVLKLILKKKAKKDLAMIKE